MKSSDGGAEVRVVRLDRGDHVVDRPPLERVHGQGPGPVDMAELWIAHVHGERAPVLGPERHPPVVGRRHLLDLAIDEAEPAITAGPADAVAGAELDALSEGRPRCHRGTR